MPTSYDKRPPSAPDLRMSVAAGGIEPGSSKRRRRATPRKLRATGAELEHPTSARPGKQADRGSDRKAGDGYHDPRRSEGAQP
jgi:hypothetical protein